MGCTCRQEGKPLGSCGYCRSPKFDAGVPPISDYPRIIFDDGVPALAALARRVEALERGANLPTVAFASNWKDRSEIAEKLAAAHYATARKFQAENEELKEKLHEKHEEIAALGRQLGDLEANQASVDKRPSAHTQATEDALTRQGMENKRLTARVAELEREKADLVALGKAAYDTTKAMEKDRDQLAHTFNLECAKVVELRRDLATARAASGVPVELVREYVDAAYKWDMIPAIVRDTDSVRPLALRFDKARAALAPYLTATPAPEPAKPPCSIHCACHYGKPCDKPASPSGESREPSDAECDRFQEDYIFKPSEATPRAKILRAFVRRFASRQPVTSVQAECLQDYLQRVMMIDAECVCRIARAFHLDEAAAREGKCQPKERAK